MKFLPVKNPTGSVTREGVVAGGSADVTERRRRIAIYSG